MRCWRMLVIFWVIIVCVVMAVPPLVEKYYWHRLEQQAGQADVVEGQQR